MGALTPALLSAWWGPIAAILAVATPMLLQWRKSRTEEGALALDEWKRIDAKQEALSATMLEKLERCENRCREVEQDNERLMAKVRDQHHRILDLEDELAGVRRQVAQLSRSTVRTITAEEAPSAWARLQQDLDKLPPVKVTKQ